MKYYLLFYFLMAPIISQAFYVDTVEVTQGESSFISYNNIEIFEDNTGQLPFSKVRSAPFTLNKNEVPNLGLSASTFWLRFHLINKTSENKLLLRISHPTLDKVTMYVVENNKQIMQEEISQNTLFFKRKIKTQDIVFEFPANAKNNIQTVYLKIKSKGPILVPLFVGTPFVIFKNISRNDLIFGIYLGIVFIMLFYNLFIFFSVKEKDYLLYVIYIAAIGLTQVCLNGYGYRYLWHNSTFITDQSVFWAGALSAIASFIFVKSFLVTRINLPFINKILTVFIVIDLIGILLSGFKLYSYSYQIINTVALLGAIVLLLCGIILAIRGYRPAKFYLIAWSFFLVSVIIYVLETYSLVPYNLFTRNILLIGSSIEIALLSFALADKINVYKKEKELSQAEALRAAREKERYISEQNIILEDKVEKRTLELKKTNKDLSGALSRLKSTQSQLVEAEKMSSLGQLTAGIAHEINNPINFVKSNIRPLTLDIQDLMELITKYEQLDKNNLEEKLKEISEYKEQIDLDYLKEEINQLLTGIEDGAVRTADIVQGLRTFSRLDEDEIKEAFIPDGIDATLTLLNSIIPPNLTIIKNYEAVPPIECYPGKLNQVFMNILTNAIQAISSKPHQGEEKLIITVQKMEDQLFIKFADTGPGISSEVKDKIFDPFFTTKDVGEGTGLGLSIVFSIIEKHKGKIEVHSEEGKGTEFVLILPVKQEFQKV